MGSIEGEKLDPENKQLSHNKPDEPSQIMYESCLILLFINYLCFYLSKPENHRVFSAKAQSS